MEYDLGRALVESTVSRALKDMETDSHRTARRMVDLGVTLSRGNFERFFFTLCWQILADEQSPYYLALEHALRTVDREHLVTFGVNVGYESCSRGAKEIRQTEAKYHYNVPWAIEMAVGEEALSRIYVQRVISEAMELGVHMFLLEDFGLSQPDLSQLLSTNPTCAFILFTTGTDTLAWNMDELKEHRNLLVSVDAEAPLALELCQRLCDARMPYCIYLNYTQGEDLSQRVVAAEVLDSVAVILRSYGAPEEVRQGVYQRVLSARSSNESPVLLLDFPSDLITIDNIISSDPFYLTIDKDGSVWVEGRKTQCRIQDMPLPDILAQEMKKEQK